MAIEGLAPSAPLLVAGILLDALLGDPQFRFHPIRLIGSTLTGFEKLLRRCGLNGYVGGCLLFGLLGLVWVAIPCIALLRLYGWWAPAGALAHVLLVYTFLALRDLLDHVRVVETAVERKDLAAARQAIAMLVGRDTAKMDLAACRRAAIESLSENFVDGYLSPVFWYALLGIPGLLLFKIASTMDSMVGYKTPQYLRFGWCGARVDDVMNYVPARLAWVVLGLSAILLPRLSARKAWRIGWEQHRILPGPNPGWSEATMAGALQRRLIGPIWKDGIPVTDIWIGDADDPEGGIHHDDWIRAVQLIIAASLIVLLGGAAVASMSQLSI
ncbi:MAG TPA: adenosylcobinamide-phosphate synthase CbiB [Anaerolineales bacterium]|jgi:adenosylcobinamide-phosphate synthase